MTQAIFIETVKVEGKQLKIRNADLMSAECLEY